MLSRLGIAICLLTVLASPDCSWGQEIHWAPNVASARKASMEYRVPVLIHFYGDDCLPCKVVEQNVLSHKEVIDTLNKYFICVKVNASQDRQSAAEYGVHSWPTDVYLSPDGKKLDQGVCKQSAVEYLSVLHGVAVMNRDRNIMLAAEQSNGANQVTSQVANYAQPANARTADTQNPGAPAMASNAMANSSLANNMVVAPVKPSGLPAAGQAPAGNPNGPNFYSQGAGTAMQQLPNSMTPNAQVTGGPTLRQDQPQAVTTAVQAVGNQIASASSPHALDANDGHLPPMQFTAQVAGTQPGRGTDPLAALVATAPTVPVAPAVVAPAVNAWNRPQTSSPTSGMGQMLDNPHYNSTPVAAISPTVQNSPTSSPANPLTAAVQSSAPPLPNSSGPSTSTAPSVANHIPPTSSAALVPQTAINSTNKIPASTVSFQPRNALSIEANTLGPHNASVAQSANHVPQKTVANKPEPSLALDGYCPVALKTQGAWVPGQTQYSVKHRGRVYHLSSQEAMREFLQNPDSSSPVMSGYDAMIFLNEGKLVEGNIQYGLHEQVSGTILLFASPESKAAYERDFDRNTQALNIVLKNAGVAQ